MSNTKTSRPNRSNSLQRMLELEKQVMNQRLQSLSSNASSSSPLPHDAPKQTTLQRGRPVRRQDPPRPRVSNDMQRSPQVLRPPPLVINPSHPRLDPAEDSTSANQATFGARNTPLVTVLAERPNPKVVAFQFPPDIEDRESVCQSPTWEAYGRRKKEKKEDRREKREEKREKKEERKEEKKEERKEEKKAQEQAKPAPEKKRRLSKPPPSSQHALHQVYAAPPSPAAPQQRSRSASAIGLASPLEEPPVRTPRTRTGSFTSLMKAFEVRRSSFDHKRDSGFIGGIKLEQEKHDAHQRALEADTLAIDGKVHPALRSKFKPGSRSSSPLRFPLGRAETDNVGQKAYPPITRQPAAGKPRSVSFSSQPSRPESGTFEKLWAYIGLKHESKDEKEADPMSAPEKSAGPAVNARGQNSQPVQGGNGAKASDNAQKSPLATPAAPKIALDPPRSKKLDQSEDMLVVEPLRLRSRPGTSDGAERKQEHQSPQVETAAKAQDKTQQSRPKTLDAPAVTREARTSNVDDSSRLMLPPAPPRRSSKRKSRQMSGAATPSFKSSLQKLEDASAYGLDSPDDYFGTFSRPYTPPALELRKLDNTANNAHIPPTLRDETTDQSDSDAHISTKRNIKNAAKAAFRLSGSFNDISQTISKPVNKKQSKPSQAPPEIMLQPRMNWSSTDDSRSETSRYSTDLSTPITSSHARSEQDLSDLPQGSKMPPTQTRAPDSPALSIASDYRQLTRDIQLEDDIGLGRIQAAANKVRTTMERRSRPNMAAEGASSARKLKQQQPWKSREELAPGNIPTPPESESDDQSRYPLPRMPNAAKNASKSTTSLQGSRRPAPTPLKVSSTQVSPLGPNTNNNLPTPPLHSGKSTASDLAVKPLRHSKASSVGDQVAKMFVECCECRYYHDMPSRLYEAMVHPDAVLDAQDSRFAGSLSMTVKCPWCKHEMSTKCCAGLAAVVHVKERLH